MFKSLKGYFGKILLLLEVGYHTNNTSSLHVQKGEEFIHFLIHFIT